MRSYQVAIPNSESCFDLKIVPVDEHRSECSTLFVRQLSILSRKMEMNKYNLYMNIYIYDCIYTVYEMSLVQPLKVHQRHPLTKRTIINHTTSPPALQQGDETFARP